MQFKILCIGKIKEAFYREEIEVICARMKKRGHSIEIIEFPDVKIPDNLKEKSREAFLEKECCRMQERVAAKDYVIALCIEGKEVGTEGHGKCLKKAEEDGFSSVVYLVGGSLGLPETLKKRADFKLSFSKMTFPHQMMRMVLCEEIENAVLIS